MKNTMNLIALFVCSLFAFTVTAQNAQVDSNEDFTKDIDGYQYSFSNETSKMFNASEDKSLEVWGQNYFHTPEILKKNKSGEVIWRKVLIPSISIWIYQLLLAKDGFIYVAATLKGNIRLPKPGGKYESFELQANPDTDEGNPLIFKLSKNGNLLWAVLLANDKDSYRIKDKPLLHYDQKSNKLTVSTELRSDGGQDMSYLFRTYTIDAKLGETVNTKEEEGGW